MSAGAEFHWEHDTKSSTQAALNAIRQNAMNKHVPHEYVTGVLYMLRDKFTVFGNETQIDEFNAGEVFLFNGKNFYSVQDGALISPAIIKKLKNEMIPASLWQERGLKWEKQSGQSTIQTQ